MGKVGDKFKQRKGHFPSIPLYLCLTGQYIYVCFHVKNSAFSYFFPDKKCGEGVLKHNFAPPLFKVFVCRGIAHIVPASTPLQWESN